MLPVLLATLGVIILGALQVRDAVLLASETDRSSALADAARAIGLLSHEVVTEYVLSNQAQPDGHPTPELGQQRTATDAAFGEFAEANLRLHDLVPGLRTASDAAVRSLDGLTAARAVAQQNSEGAIELRASYDGIVAGLLTLADAIPPQMSDTRLIELSRSVAITAELDRLAALQLDLITRGLDRHLLQPGEPIQLAEWVGSESKEVQDLVNMRPAGDLYEELMTEPGVATAASIRQVILDGHGTEAALRTDPQAWSAAQAQRVDGLWRIEQQLASALKDESARIGRAAREQTYLVGALSGGFVAATLVGAAIMAIRISRRLRRTRYAALTAARIELPTAISHVIAARDATMVRAALTDSSGRIEAMLSSGSDEIGELSAAFGTVHRQALRLAADQAMLRMEVQALFVALSRRGQTLVQRQIHLIDEFGRDEADPEALAKLFALDHLAARMRRNEENLLVLAGGEPGRWITRPVAMVDLVRAAAQEIEEYRRIDLGEAAAVAVSAHIAGDAIHLLAELLENATTFSPPHTMVTVTARRDIGGMTIRVSDRGIGMPERQLAEANDRLTRPLSLTSSLVGTMGLLVVARLAQRHGIHVHLDAKPAGGATATVIIPDRYVLPLSAVDRLEPSRWQRELELTAEHTGELPAPAVTSLPAAGPGIAAAIAPAPRNGVPAPATLPLPSAPTPPTPSPGPWPRPPQLEPVHDLGRTAAGLPRRPTDDAMAFQPEIQAPPAMPDPELVRARLSSLATGLAAAQQDVSPPSTVDSQSRGS
jgi:signal transduction histidine kinase